MRGGAVTAMLVLAACPAKPPARDPVALPAEGTSIAIFVGRDATSVVAMIDDRRRIVVEHGAFELDRIDPGAQLPSLVIEAIDGTPFALGSCMRERSPNTALEALGPPRPPARQGQPRQGLPVLAAGVLAPKVTCRVTAAPGPHAIRVVQITPLAGFRTFHQVTYGGGATAKLTTKFVFTTPAWHEQRAEFAVFDGLPAGEQPPKQIARGSLVLDGTTTVLANPTVEVGARLRAVFDGAVRDPSVAPTEASWGRESRSVVSNVLELDRVELGAGQLDVHFEGVMQRDASVALGDRERVGDQLRLILEPVPGLRASRRNFVDVSLRRGKTIQQRITLSVTNDGLEPRALAIEEHLRPRLARVLADVPSAMKLVGDTLRADVVIPPHETIELAFRVTYVL